MSAVLLPMLVGVGVPVALAPAWAPLPIAAARLPVPFAVAWVSNVLPPTMGLPAARARLPVPTAVAEASVPAAMAPSKSPVAVDVVLVPSPTAKLVAVLVQVEPPGAHGCGGVKYSKLTAA